MRRAGFLFIAEAPLVAEQELWGVRALVAPQHVGSPGLGIDHVSSALAARFLTTRPKGSPLAGLLGEKIKVTGSSGLPALTKSALGTRTGAVPLP